MAYEEYKEGLSPAAQQVYAALYVGGNDGALSASFNEPEGLHMDKKGERDEIIKEYGLCIGLAFAQVAKEHPYLDGEQLANRAEAVGKEAFFVFCPETKRDDPAPSVEPVQCN